MNIISEGSGCQIDLGELNILIDRYRGDVIKELRLNTSDGKRWLTLQKLSTKIDISKTFLSQLENGLRKPSTKNLISIANIFNVPLVYFDTRALCLAVENNPDQFTDDFKKRLALSLEFFKNISFREE